MKSKEDIEWLRDYCKTLGNLLKNEPNMPYVEKSEIRGKLQSSRQQLREWEAEYGCK